MNFVQIRKPRFLFLNEERNDQDTYAAFSLSSPSIIRLIFFLIQFSICTKSHVQIKRRYNVEIGLKMSRLTAMVARMVGAKDGDRMNGGGDGGGER